MKNILLVFMFLNLSFTSFVFSQEEDIHIAVTAQKAEKMKLFVGCCRDYEWLKQVADIVIHDLEFNGQFQVILEPCTLPSHKHDISNYYEQGYLMALFLDGDHKKNLEWRLYDTQQEEMIHGRKMPILHENIAHQAHCISDAIWQEVTGEQGIFSTKITYCKDVFDQKGKKYSKHIYLADYNGEHPYAFVQTSRINIAPRWNRDKKRPLLFYSEYTPTNLRLMATDLDGNRSIASNLKGLNMLPAFSEDGKMVIFCLSHQGKSNLYRCNVDRSNFKRLTNKGNNISPTIVDDTGMYFCSNYQNGRPQIYFMDLATETMQCLTAGGYCVSPNYSSASKKLVYAKMVQGLLQIFIYDPQKGTHEQITFDNRNKEECSWSPCGNYVIFSTEKNGKSRIALCHVNSRNIRYLTPLHEHCMYPVWAPADV